MQEHDNNITPSTVPGTDPGSIYTVIGRTKHGYVAIRRLSKYCYRVRCAKFDGTPLVTVSDQELITNLTKHGIKIGDEGKYLSAFGYNANLVLAAAGTMMKVLYVIEPTPDTYLEAGTDEDYLAIDKQIDEEKAKQALKQAAPEVNVPPKIDDLQN